MKWAGPGEQVGGEMDRLTTRIGTVVQLPTIRSKTLRQEAYSD